MALSEKKSKIINKIKLYISIANSDVDEKYLSTLESLSDDPVEFLIDLIKTTIGENVLETVVQNGLSKVLTQKKLDEYSNAIYDSIGGNLSEKSFLPNAIKNDGITIPIKSIDVTDSFRKVGIPGSTASQNTNQFFKDMTERVLNSPGSEVSLSVGAGVGGVSVQGGISALYNEQTSDVKIKFGISNTGGDVSQKQIFELMKSSIGPLFSASVVINEIINILFHTDFSREDAQLLTFVRSYTKYENKDVFKLDLKKLLDLELATELKGLNVDTNCFKENIEITQQQIDAVINNPNIKSFNALVPELNTDTTSNFKNDYHKNILKTIIEALIMMVLKQPGVMFFMNITKKILDPNFSFSVSISDIFENFKRILEIILDYIYRDFFCIIFNYIKKFIIKLVIVLTIKFIKEQLQKRRDILGSLTIGEAINRAKSFI